MKPLRLSLTVFLFIVFLQPEAQYVWRHKACLPAPGRRVQASFSVGNKGYVVGGRVLPGTSVADVWEYDPGTDTWQPKKIISRSPWRVLPPLLLMTQLTYVWVTIMVQPVILQSAIHMSRLRIRGQRWQIFQALEGTQLWNLLLMVKLMWAAVKTEGKPMIFTSYDPGSNTWTEKASFPGAARQSGFSRTIDTFGYMGLGAAGSTFNDSYRYDAYSDTWTPIANFPVAPPACPGYFVY